MAALTLDVDAVRARFSALDTDWALFDAPGGTQVPDSVVDAIAGYLRGSNANLGGRFEASVRSDALVTDARVAAASFLGSTPDEVVFGANASTLNFALSRTLARELRAGDEILATKLDHDANVAPWLELAHDLDLTVQLVEVHADTTLDLDDLERKLSERTRVVAFPLASNAVGTDRRRGARRRARALGRRACLGRRRPLRTTLADRRDRARRRRSALLAVQVLRAAPRPRRRPRRRARALAPVQGAPRAERAARRALRDRHAGARAARGVSRGRRLRGRARLGRDPRARARAGRAAPRWSRRALDAARAADDGRPRPDVRAHARLALTRRRRPPPGRAEARGLGRGLLRRRGDGAARAPGRRGTNRARPLQHRRRGRAAARRAGRALSGRPRARGASARRRA